MSTATTLKSILSPLVAGGCFNSFNPSETVVLPYIVFYEIVGMPINLLHGGVAATKKNYQVEVFARSPEHAEGIAKGVMFDAIIGSVLEGTPISEMNGQYSEKDKSHQYITEWQVWDL